MQAVPFCGSILMTTLDEVLQAAQKLPSAQRAQLIATLWDGVIPDDWVPPTEDWVQESQCRIDAYESGQMTSSSWSEVRQRARNKAGLGG